MNHTPEPWHLFNQDGKRGIFSELYKAHVATLAAHNKDGNGERIVACVNGCAGLNPAAYRACVEAVRGLLDLIEECSYCEGKGKNYAESPGVCPTCGGQGETLDASGRIGELKQALAHAEGRT